LSIETELREAVLAAATRPAVSESVAAVYSTLGDAVELRRPLCSTSGRCCRFEEYGHRLYVTTLELAKFVADLTIVRTMAAIGASSERNSASKVALPIISTIKGSIAGDGGGCRFQMEGLCGVHALRPFGCRIFFCDETSTAWQHETYERLHARLRTLHDELFVPYFYVEWRFALEVCLWQASPESGRLRWCGKLLHQRLNTDFATGFVSEGAAMKTIALLGLLAGALMTTGCFGTPGYSGTERNDIIVRDYNYDGGQLIDDFDHDVIMSRPASGLTAWNVR
jgi:Fe-S-cluster containining protein